MRSTRRESAQRLLAIVVIIAMLLVMGIPPAVVIFFTVVTYFVWRTVNRSEHQETGRIFEFYLAANDILQNAERRWYGFEINEVTEEGERILRGMEDAPPLVYFALGALYHKTGDYHAAAEHLSNIVEDELSDELHRISPSPALARYVTILRKLEQTPAEAPRTVAAIRSLERARFNRAFTLLEDCQRRIKSIPTASNVPPREASAAVSRNRSEVSQEIVDEDRPHTQPPPIAEVLRDLYEEEKKTA